MTEHMQIILTDRWSEEEYFTKFKLHFDEKLNFKFQKINLNRFMIREILRKNKIYFKTTRLENTTIMQLAHELFDIQQNEP